MNKSIQIAVCRIMALAVTLEVGDVFVEWQPHTKGIHVRFYPLGWSPGAEAEWLETVYLDIGTALTDLARLYDRISSEAARAATTLRSHFAEKAVLETMSSEMMETTDE